MNRSETIGEIAKAMNAAQPNIKVAIKDSSNPFFKSKYADLQAVWDACKEALHANGLSVMQMPSHIDGEPALETILAHTSGQWLSGVYPLSPTKRDPQGVGAAITYARRYALAALVGVVYDEDDDGETSHGRGKVTPDGKTANKKPKYTDSQTTRAGELRQKAMGYAGGDDAYLSLWRLHAYSDPAVFIKAAEQLIEDLVTRNATSSKG